MPDFGFVGTSYEAPSIYQDAQECINFYAEIDPQKQPGERGVVALYPTPGLTLQTQLAVAEVRGLHTLSGETILIAVSVTPVVSPPPPDESLPPLEHAAVRSVNAHTTAIAAVQVLERDMKGPPEDFEMVLTFARNITIAKSDASSDWCHPLRSSARFPRGVWGIGHSRSHAPRGKE